ncbi:hypothetical protein HZC07_04610 [Candidatus Micrarchaeota archaeon]|nr:hypothetical protein [Candidatus Micrarchaeota archaeon]
MTQKQRTAADELRDARIRTVKTFLKRIAIGTAIVGSIVGVVGYASREEAEKRTRQQKATAAFAKLRDADICVDELQPRAIVTVKGTRIAFDLETPISIDGQSIYAGNFTRGIDRSAGFEVSNQVEQNAQNGSRYLIRNFRNEEIIKTRVCGSTESK